MSADAQSRRNDFLADENPPERVKEALADYDSGSSTIDIDTRLASTGETESIWPGRPARRSVIRSIERGTDRHSGSSDSVAYRGDDSTSHTRRDLLTGDWTIFAPKRDERPNEYSALEAAGSVPSRRDIADHQLDREPGCPFCAGAENQTPEAIWSAKLGDLEATPADDATSRFGRPKVEIVSCSKTDWDARVVPNKFPAVSPSNATFRDHIDRDELFPISDVVGGHEVIIESPVHAESMTQFDSSFVYLTLMAYRDRMLHWRSIPGIEYISVFKNCGPDAGASLRHSHSQLIATSLMPQQVRTTLMRCESHRARTGCSLGCDLLRQEMTERRRLIDRTDSFVAFCPFASRFAGLVRITSVAHQPQFETFSDSALDQLASFLWRVLTWVDTAFPGRAFNYLLHTCPPGSTQPEAFQWSLDIFPRLNKTAGFEWSSDCMINSVLPEAIAARYREIARQNDPRFVLTGR